MIAAAQIIWPGPVTYTQRWRYAVSLADLPDPPDLYQSEQTSADVRLYVRRRVARKRGFDHETQPRRGGVRARCRATTRSHVAGTVRAPQRMDRPRPGSARGSGQGAPR